ncbi:Laccase-5 [Habropoda laboriosa]|uniref:Laccase-5 n=2 Tax=Habropoda laboriosa TaxID=597456 RepID=A0A0L7RG21_9HYME|nr:Laccase-5 [Habropoda laboriosa]
MPPINRTTCQSDKILRDTSLSDAFDCARTCHLTDKPKTCYYKFVIERYPVSGQACDLCTPNISNTICPNCQCVPTDGVQRMALTVNRMIPGPSIQVCLGDYLVIDVVNKVKEDAITIHWHGVFQEDYQYYDGVPQLTQCPIIFATSFRYQFMVKNSGTHFWHAHTGLNKMDGIHGALIVRDPVETDPSRKYFETDLANHVIIIADWFHEESTERYPGRNAGVTGQHPDTFLINGKGQFTDANGTTTNTSLEVITVEANKRHRIRLINSFCATCPGQLTVENHNLSVIAIDGNDIEPLVVNSIVSFPGERYDFVINTNQTPGSYWIQLRALDDCEARSIQQLAILQYVNASGTPASSRPTYSTGIPVGAVLNPLDVSCNTPNPTAICINQVKTAIPIRRIVRQTKADYQFVIPIGFHAYTQQEIYQPNQYAEFIVPGPGVSVSATLDGVEYISPPSPPLSQYRDVSPEQYCNSQNLPRGCSSNCKCTHLLKVALNSLVEIVLIDTSQVEQLSHPFHLHGYAFRVVSMGQPLGPYSFTGNATVITTDYVKQLDSEGKIERNLDTAPGKDTLAVPNNGYVVLRFVANNPGFWLFHCHFVYHQIVGMEVVIQVGELRDLPPVPRNFPKCGNFEPDIYGNRVDPWLPGRGRWGPPPFGPYGQLGPFGPIWPTS